MNAIDQLANRLSVIGCQIGRSYDARQALKEALTEVDSIWLDTPGLEAYTQSEVTICLRGIRNQMYELTESLHELDLLLAKTEHNTRQQLAEEQELAARF